MNNNCEFDIEGEAVFSVERQKTLEKFCLFGQNEYSERTIIGFYRKDGANKRESWYLDCTPEKHAEFVSRFRRKLGLI